MPSKPPKLDMNPMADLAFLLVTFFLLATQLRADEPVIVDQPASQSENKIPEKNLLKILVSEEGRIFFGVSDKPVRKQLIQQVANDFNLNISENEINSFALVNSFGIPVKELSGFLDKPLSQRKNMEQPGIPMDSTRNELEVWVRHAKNINKNLTIAIKGDQNAGYSRVKQIIDMLVNRGITNIHLITELDNGQDS